MLRHAAAPCLLAAACAACSGEGQPAAEAQGEQEQAEKLTDGESRARIAVGGGGATLLRSGPKVPANLPPGFTVYPQARILEATLAEQRERRHALVAFETRATVPQVMGFYRAQARRAGAGVTLDLEGDRSASLGGTLPAGGTFALSVRRQGVTRVQFSFE